MYKLAVFVSGRGSNLKAIHNQIVNGSLNAEISVVVSNSQNAKAIDFVKEQNITFYIISKEKGEEFFVTYEELTDKLVLKNINLIVLAGFLKKIPSELIVKFRHRIINIHPALLPSFGGKGMYGINVHQAVFNSSAKVSGATIHFVDEIYDNGKIIAQQSVDISDVASPEEISERVLKIEHELLPNTIKKFVENKIKITENRIFIDS
ncbi:MAG: phosphoribosylglycinamide formyltransferase [Ignavibacteriae bacterium]|nr:phosphoribosylglycinamide formyltransferase [Ignavibacteriota bacterium]